MESEIVVLGGGPAGLYCALLLKKADPSRQITVIERNPAGVTYGWGVVFSDRTLASFQQADYRTYKQISDSFVIWDSIDVHYRGEVVSCGGHVIAAISRKLLLEILQRRCEELGVDVRFNCDITDLSQLPECDLLIAADGINSLVRRTLEAHFRPRIELGKAKYIWLGAERVLDAFNFIFHENEHGLFQVHAYPFSGTTSTFIVECEEATWLRAGLDKATEEESLAYCQRLLDGDLRGTRLLSNNSKWISFPTLKTQQWHVDVEIPGSGRRTRVVLLGDAAHTAHFSIGSGTKLAMEDAIGLANAIEEHSDVDTALDQYELERRPVVDTFQRAARESQTYFETLKRYLVLEPVQFAFQLLTRSGRITYDDLRFRDAGFGEAVDRSFFANAQCKAAGLSLVDRRALAPAPLFAPFRLRGLTLDNRVVRRLPGGPNEASKGPAALLPTSGLVLTEMCAVSPDGRISPETPGIYQEEQVSLLSAIVHQSRGSGCAVGLVLGHAGRRGATRDRPYGTDRPLRDGAWPLIAASPLPYTPRSQTPKEMDRADMNRVRDDFVLAAQRANEAEVDFLQLHFAHGYLLGGFLSPLANQRRDEYGGSLENRLRFPLEVLDAVRVAWPEVKPLCVAIPATDCAPGGLQVEDGIAIARALKEHGCDLVEVLAGQSVPDAAPAYGRGFLTHYADRIRNEAGIATMVGGYLVTTNEINTILAAGRADLCILSD